MALRTMAAGMRARHGLAGYSVVPAQARDDGLAESSP
jgi:hypothetical protein